MLKIIGRVLIILLAAAIVAGGVYALAQAGGGAGPAGFQGGLRDGQARAGGPPPGRGQGAQDGSGLGEDFGGSGHGREAMSLARGLPELLKNVAIVGFLIGAVSLVRRLTRRPAVSSPPSGADRRPG
jgi:hypothetical protein